MTSSYPPARKSPLIKRLVVVKELISPYPYLEKFRPKWLLKTISDFNSPNLYAMIILMIMKSEKAMLEIIK